MCGGPVEQPLSGGNTTPGIVRIGNTVRRPRDGRSPFVAEALSALETMSFPYAPRWRGIDDRGRDILTYLEGTTTSHPLERDERCYRDVAVILASLHRLTRGTPVAGDGMCLVHGDPGPFNVVMRAGRPVGLIDWDSVHPGDPREDVGYAAWTWCIQAPHGAAVDIPIPDQARRVRAFRDGYDPALPAHELLDAIRDAQTSIVEVEGRNAQDRTLSEARRSHARGAVRWATEDRGLLDRRRDAFEDALARSG